MTSEELLELEQEHITEEEAGEKETSEEEKEEEVTVKHLAKVLVVTISSLKHLKTWTPTLKGFH